MAAGAKMVPPALMVRPPEAADIAALMATLASAVSVSIDDDDQLIAALMAILPPSVPADAVVISTLPVPSAAR